MEQINSPSVINYNLKKVNTYDGFTFYVDDELNIYSKSFNKLKPRETRDGYYTVYCRKTNGSGTNRFVHRIIAQAFLMPNLDDRYEVHHKDKNPSNNSLDNLEVMLRYDHKLEHNLKYPEQKQCIVCGKWFTPNITKRKRAKVCSEECKHIIYIETGKKKENLLINLIKPL